jgi:hypothetical protein
MPMTNPAATPVRYLGRTAEYRARGLHVMPEQHTSDRKENGNDTIERL